MQRVRQRAQDPIFWASASQLVKTVLAAVAAWAIAHHVLGLAQSFLAPWAALLVVNATIYRTMARGAQQVGATVVGVLLAFAAGRLLGVDAASLGAALLVAMLFGSARALRDESTTAATTALIVLLAGYSDDGGVLLTRLLDTGVGVAVGLAVNLLVWPPLHDRSAARRVDRIDDMIGALMTRIAREIGEHATQDHVDGWVAETREIDAEIDRAWATVSQARESGRLNLRRSAGRRMQATKAFEALLKRLEQANAELRSLARTLGRTGALSADWDPGFQAVWLPLLTQAGHAVTEAEADRLAHVRADLESAAEQWFGSGEHHVRPVHGALLVNLRNVVEALDTVVDAQPVHEDVPRRRAVARADPRTGATGR